MSAYRVSFEDGRFIEEVTVHAGSREEAQEIAIDFWEEQGIVHGDLVIRLEQRAMPLLPY